MLCSVIGTPFYIMEYVKGRIFKDPSLPGMSNETRTVIFLNIFLKIIFNDNIFLKII